MTKQKRLEASLYKGLRHMREVIYKALAVKDPGGGRPNMAQAGGKNPAGIGKALEEAEKVLEGQLS